MRVDSGLFRTTAAWLMALVYALALPSEGLAHDPLTSWTNVFIRTDAMTIELTLSRQEAALLIDEAAPPVGRLDEETFRTRLRPVLLGPAAGVYRVTVDGTPLFPTQVDVSLSEELNFLFWAKYPRPQGETLVLEAVYLESMSFDHSGSIDVYVDRVKPLLWDFIDREYTTVEMSCPQTPSDDAGPDPIDGQDNGVEGPSRAVSPPFARILYFGFEHILIGYDHLLFLAGLLIVCPGFADIAKIVTCFTLAHSLTLGLAALDVAVLPGALVESAIAASIVYVGIENLVCRGAPRHRWRLTFLFGLIHGFGFAGVFRELVGDGTVAKPLFAFNLGVELGQISIVALVLPFLLLLHRRDWFGKYAVPTLSGLIAVMGGFWFVTRTFT